MEPAQKSRRALSASLGRVNESDFAEAALRIEEGSVRESGHTLGIVDQTSQTDGVQTEAEHLYNQ
jgi:hypothetical protein